MPIGHPIILLKSNVIQYGRRIGLLTTEKSKSLSFQIKSQLQGFQVTEQAANGEQGSNIIRTQKSKLLNRSECF